MSNSLETAPFQSRFAFGKENVSAEAEGEQSSEFFFQNSMIDNANIWTHFHYVGTAFNLGIKEKWQVSSLKYEVQPSSEFLYTTDEFLTECVGVL